MTVAELIQTLQDYVSDGGDPTTPVGFQYNYGDRSHTQVFEIARDAEEARTVFSSYHRSHRMLDDDGDDDTAYNEARVVFCITGFAESQ